ncbi:gas vesicle protein [Pedococcus sp. 5OH_020]|uniref:gas vesicle protein n=1 Tax=Pedococcus sp. 5OH_020 TaxID=2989814 RepID=UPI0022E9AF0A|nr:gas vesicle protein [Pedococcus sp. 5OH_020]
MSESPARERPPTGAVPPTGPTFVGMRGQPPQNLADVLERVLDKGIVIVGDIQVRLLDIELLTIKVRLMVASVERAQEMGINWWESDPFVSTGGEENRGNGHQDQLERRLAALEQRVAGRSTENGTDARPGERRPSEVRSAEAQTGEAQPAGDADR